MVSPPLLDATDDLQGVIIIADTDIDGHMVVKASVPRVTYPRRRQPEVLVTST